MENCKCELHAHQSESKANIYGDRDSQGMSSNRPLEIISQYSQISVKNKGNKPNGFGLFPNH